MNPEEKQTLYVTSLSHALIHIHELSVPLLISIWINNWNISAGTIGIIVTVGYALFGLGALPSGLITNNIGSRIMMVTGLGGIGIGFVILSLVSGPMGLVLAMGVWGLSASIHHPAALSMISQNINKRGEGFAYHGMAGAAGIAIGPLITSILLIYFSWNTTCFILGLPAILGSYFALSLPQKKNDKNIQTTDDSRTTSIASFGEFWKKSKQLLGSLFILLLISFILEGLYYRGILTFLETIFQDFELIIPPILQDLTVEPSKLLYVLIFPTGILGQYVGGKLSDRIRPELGISITLLILSVTALLFIWILSWGIVPLLIIGMCLGFFLFMIQPLYQATVANHTSSNNRGLAYGYTFLCIFGLGSPGAAIAGWIVQYQGPELLFGVLGGIAALASSFIFLFFYKTRSYNSL